MTCSGTFDHVRELPTRDTRCPPGAPRPGTSSSARASTGELRIEHYEGEQLVESHTDYALWELMYFGKARL
jgi:hypothetical protein